MISFYLTEGLKSLSRAKFATLVLIFTTCLTILFALGSISLVFLSNRIENKLSNNITLNAFLDSNISDSARNELKSDLNKIDAVANVTFISSSKAKESFLKETGKDFESLLEVNPLPSSFIIKLKSQHIQNNKVKTVVDKISSYTGITDVVYDYDFILKSLSIINQVKIIIYFLSMCLVFISLYFYYALNSFIIKTKEKQITSMKLVGAKLSSIRIPFFVSSITIGIVSAIITSAVSTFALFLISNIYFISSFTKILYFSNLIILILGLILGILGGLFSIRRITLNVSK